MKLSFAGPLFTTSERSWNAEVVAALHAVPGQPATEARAVWHV